MAESTSTDRPDQAPPGVGAQQPIGELLGTIRGRVSDAVSRCAALAALLREQGGNDDVIWGAALFVEDLKSDLSETCNLADVAEGRLGALA